MFGTWISDVQRELSAAFPADQSYSAEDLASSHMPTAVGFFLRHALQRRSARVEFSVESDWFDADAEVVRVAFDAYRDALASTARYPQPVWQSSLERATQFVIGYIVDPSRGLVSFAYGDTEEPIGTERMKERLAYFGATPALQEAIVNHLDRQGLAEIGPEDLRAIVLKADQTLVQSYDQEQWTNHLAPLFEIAAFIRTDENAKPELPTDLLRAFFAVKGCEEIVRRLEAVESVKGVHGLDVDAVRNVVTEPEPIAEEPEPEIAVMTENTGQITRVVRNDTHRDAASPAVPRWMQFAGGVKPQEREADPRPLQVPDPIEDYAALDADEFADDGLGKIGQRAPIPDELSMQAAGDGMGVPRWTQFQGASAPVPASVDDGHQAEERVMGSLNAVQRAWFVNHLFGSDTAQWSSVMELLSNARDWNEASGIIATEVFERHGVDIYSRPAVDFTNAVEARMR